MAARVEIYGSFILFWRSWTGLGGTACSMCVSSLAHKCYRNLAVRKHPYFGYFHHTYLWGQDHPLVSDCPCVTV